MMKVLWFGNSSLYSSINTYHGGGWVSSLYYKLKERYPNDIIFSLAFNWNDDINDTKQNINFYGIKNYKRAWLHYDEIQSKRKARIKEVVEIEKPDIIHVFGTESGLGLVGLVTDIPVVIHIQGILSALWEGWLPQNVSWNTLYLRSIYEYLSKKSLLKDIEREKLIFRSCKYLMGRTAWDKSISSFMAPNAKYFYCGEMLRPEIYNSTKIWSLHNRKKKIIVSVVSQAIYKGNDTILRTAKALKEFYGENFEWKVYGVKNMDFQVKRTSVDPDDVNVFPMGVIDANGLVNVLTEADLFVHPSNIENSPNSVCEAQLLGIPIVATNAGGVSSLVKDEDDGLLVAPRDVYAMASKIARLLNNPQETDMLSKKGRLHALERHNPNMIVENLFKIYKELLSE